MALLFPVKKIARAGRASISQLLIIPAADVVSLAFDEFERVSNITLATGAAFLRVDFFRGTGFFNQAKTRNVGANVITQTIQFELGRLNADNRQALGLLSNASRLHALVQDSEGSWMYAGISYLADRDVWVSEYLQTAGGSANTSASFTGGRNSHIEQLVATTAYYAPFLSDTVDIDNLPITEPVPGDRLNPDTTPPIPILHSPEIGQNAVDVNITSFAIAFNEFVRPVDNMSGLVQLRRFADDTLVATWDLSTLAAINYDPFARSFEFLFLLGPLDYDTPYYITIAPGAVFDGSGNAFAGYDKPLNADDAWYFRTRTAPNLTPPQLVSTSPADNGTYAEGEFIRLTFDETIQTGTGVMELYLVGAGPSYTLINTYSVFINPAFTVQGRVLIIDIDSDLTPGATYELRFSAGAVQDADFNNWAGMGSGVLEFTVVANGYSQGFTIGFDS